MKELPRRGWCYYENIGGGQNIRLTPIEDEEVGPQNRVDFAFIYVR